jgi:hypothetical protein
MARIDNGERGVSTPAKQGADAISDMPAVYALADLIDLSGDLKAQDIGGTRRRRIEPLPLEEVGAVHPGRPHPNANLARTCHWIGAISDLQSCRRPLAVFDLDHAHHDLPSLAFGRVRARNYRAGDVGPRRRP